VLCVELFGVRCGTWRLVVHEDLSNALSNFFNFFDRLSTSVEAGDLFVHGTQAAGDGSADADQQPGGGLGVLVDVGFEAFGIDAPDLAEFDGCDSCAGGGGVEQVDFTYRFACANAAEQHLVPSAHGGCMKFAADDEIEAGLHAAFFNQVTAGLNWLELAIAAEDVTILVTKRFHDAKCGDLWGGEVCAHFFGDGRF
jgi:hypothetical protein